MITRRICTVCKVEKSFDEFYKSKKGKYGISAHCKACKLVKDRIYYKNNKKKLHDKHNRWAKRNRDRLNKENRERYAKNPEKYKEWTKAYRKRTGNASIKKYKQKHPGKRMAHRYVDMAVYFGDLKRPETCDVCKIPCKPQAHHDDYEKPLDVRWLCSKCHGIQHRKKPTIKDAERLSERTSKEDAIV